VNRGNAVGLSRGKQILKEKPVILSGSYLMRQGLTLPWAFPDTMWVIEGSRMTPIENEA
jgi:alpha-galactosidase